jgi:Protein of unknown function (DUF993)
VSSVGTDRCILLPTSDGRLAPFPLGEPSTLPGTAAPPRTRVAFAAAHVVADALADVSPWLDAAIDWDATLAYRRYLWRLGLSVAEAMDTAQRGMGLDWPASQDLIRHALAEARAEHALDRIACGAGTDHIAGAATLDQIVAAYEEQCAFVERHDGRIILMASRALAATAAGPEEYAQVYDRVLSQVSAPVIIHWLGDMFTGDDFNSPVLIESGSDALLGIFDAMAPAASVALAAFDEGDTRGYHAIFAPTLAQAALLHDPEQAADRMRCVLRLAGSG